MSFYNKYLSNEKCIFVDNSRAEPTIFSVLFSLRFYSGHFYGQSFNKTVRGPLNQHYPILEMKKLNGIKSNFTKNCFTEDYVKLFCLFEKTNFYYFKSMFHREPLSIW